MQQIITKFGGTSVSTRENWEHIASITLNHIHQGFQPVIVCSALSQASNQLETLIEAAIINEHYHLEQTLKQRYELLAEDLDIEPDTISNDLEILHQLLTGIALLKEAPAKIRAQILSLGELMLSRLGHVFLQSKGITCLWLDARSALTSIDIAGGEYVNYLAARCLEKPNPQLAQKLQQSGAQAILTQGFIASNKDGSTVLLGRGGSDTSAALFAAILQAKRCEIWTDVPGIYTANPHQLPHARLLKRLNYDEAQEIATMGAKVLHPNCLPPVRQASIPMAVKYTSIPEHSGTEISHETDEHAPPIKSIQVKENITLISIDTLSMWQQVGFLADVFTTFKKHGFSVDLLSSSEFNVTVSLDVNARLRDRACLNLLVDDLNQFGRANIIEPCSAISLVGHNIRIILPKLGPTLELFEAQQIHMMSLASNDLNLTFVVAESQAHKLCQKLHALLIENNPQSYYYSKSWQEEFGEELPRERPWWEQEQTKLLKIARQHSPAYVYNIKLVREKAHALKKLQAIDTLFYAIKANSHPEILRAIYKEGIGFECVSIGELQHVLALFPDIDKNRILFTPNFCDREEYAFALSLGCYITIDNQYPLITWPHLFQNHAIILRIDPGSGSGHHKYVCTGGNESKFGIPKDCLADIANQCKQHNIDVIGLHAHSGSGILSPELWQQTAIFLAMEAKLFPNVVYINLGGGLGIVEKPGQTALDLTDFDASLLAVKTQYPNISFWLEPGRYFVAESGVILAKVTQCKEKGNVNFIGIETGMNSLLRPALYGSYHEIVNLSRLYEDKALVAHIVGPVCESGDTLGYDRWLPLTQAGDYMLIANTGAYGHCMSSSYNLREPAQEIIIGN